jgi:hypothetical protein
MHYLNNCTGADGFSQTMSHRGKVFKRNTPVRYVNNDEPVRLVIYHIVEGLN